MTLPRLSPRERSVLLAIIESYIATGEPVASQALARLWAHKEGLSAATLRNVMASLGEAGLLDRAHTSAGRIPTPLAFRFYVEQLPPRENALSLEHRAAMRPDLTDAFQGVSSAPQFLERAAQVLASISTGLGIALLTASDTHSLEHIHFSRLGPLRVLAVLVTTAGVVLDRVLAMPRELAPSELDEAARYLNSNFRGWSIPLIRAELSSRMAEEQSAYDRLLRSVEELCSTGALNDAQPGGVPQTTVYIGGLGNLLAGGLDPSMLRQLLAAIEEKQRLVSLLEAYVDANRQTVRVVVGLEDSPSGLPEMSNFVLIGAPTRLGENRSGTLAVLAPTRLEYGKTIDAVAFLAQLPGTLLRI